MELGSRARAVARPLTHRLGRAVPTPARRRAVTALVAVVALGLGSAVTAYAVTPPPAHEINGTLVGLKEVGPIDETNGFPLWYKDTNDVKLELCVDPDDQYCAVVGERPDPQAPVSFPDNFPDEAFWAVAESPIDAGGGESGILVTAVEAAFQNELPAVNEQVSFGRVRIRVAGVVDGATYRVTHPFGTDTIVAETGAVKGLNVTEDIGSLTWDGVFDQTLGARTGPFLKWTNGEAPAGYLGDPAVEHPVTGSPYGTNFFRVEGPAGSFTGSTMLCADPLLGDDQTATDDCIQNDDFVVQGKIATRMGVQVTNATYRDRGTGTAKYIDLFAKSEPNQRLVVSGTGVSQTEMRGDGNGKYYARILVDGTPPNDLKVTNTTDNPNTVDHVEAALFGDRVHVTSAAWDTIDQNLTVIADSGDASAVLTLEGFPPADVTVTPSGSNGVRTFVVEDLPIPPSEVTVSSDKGGSDSDDVVITGTEFDAAQVQAFITADTNEISANQPLTLDSTASTGTITGRSWSVSGGGTLQAGATAESRTFTASSAGDYTVTLTVTGPGSGNVDSDTFVVHVSGAATPPEANAGIDQENVVPTSIVTLNGSASRFATGYSWSIQSGPNVSLSSTTTANPTFTMPASTTQTTWVFQLTATGPGGTDTDTVLVSNDPDDLGVDAAQYKRGGTEWRVRGTAQHCSANNTVSVYWNRPGVANPILLGTATPALDLGVCTWDFRLKNTPAAQRPTAATLGTITVRSSLGGEVLNRTYTFL
jgi:hypothetical protein